MAIQTDTRVYDNDTPGFDYQVTQASRYFYDVTHAGKYVGRVAQAANGEFWTAWAAVVFGDKDQGNEPIGSTTGTMSDAVALINDYWANQ